MIVLGGIEVNQLTLIRLVLMVTIPYEQLYKVM